uniref:LRRCT domain-containing protein n=1 Tax=Anabas testudineus TaxID=64144 RepID=A0AAQ6IQH1_ANATE
MHLFLHLLILLSHVAIVTAVAGCLSDRDKDHRPRENCTEAGFSDIPAGLGVTTRVLLFPRNLFTSLSWSSFQTFTEIYEIDLTGNKVPEVTPGGAPILPSLSVLRLGSNHLKSLSDGSFSACPALTELYLENNAITSLTDHTFSGLSLLEILDLSSNHISVLPKLMLHPLPAIETLYVENNKIKVMPDDWFSKKEEVPYLYLSANPWACNCSLDYLHRYLNDYELNVYVRDGPIISSDIESVVCDSPQYHKGKAVVSLEESDLCSPSTEWALNTYRAVEYEGHGISNTPSYWLTHGVPTEAPNIHISTPRNTFHTTTTTPAITSAARQMSTAVYRKVVTWTWYQTFASLIEWSDHSGGRGDGSLFGSRDIGTHSPFPTVTPSTESPAIMTTTVPTVTPSTESPAIMTTTVPTVTPSTESPPIMTTTVPTVTPSTESPAIMTTTVPTVTPSTESPAIMTTTVPTVTPSTSVTTNP